MAGRKLLIFGFQMGYFWARHRRDFAKPDRAGARPASRCWTVWKWSCYLKTLASIAIIATGLLTACSPSSAPAELVLEGPAMGTTYSIKVVGATEESELRALVKQQLAAVDRKMSTYRGDSELSRFNRHWSVDPFPLSVETLEVIRLALEVSEATGGAFDITVALLVEAWGFGPANQAEPPSPESLTRLRNITGWRKLHLGKGSVSKEEPALSCDLSAIAKGYAVDRIAGAFAAAGHARYMIELGGEVRTSGRNRHGEPWRIGVEQPIEDRREIFRVLPIEDLAMATSGDYRNYRDLDGERLTHIIDPRTTRPIRHKLAAVTVLDPLCARADAFATALMVLGESAGYEVATREGLAALFLVHTGDGGLEARATPRFEELFPEISR